MTCPYCQDELKAMDEYGTGCHESFYGTGAMGIHYPDTWEKEGDIFKCINEDCEMYGNHFYIRNGDLIEGYPC